MISPGKNNRGTDTERALDPDIKTSLLVRDAYQERFRGGGEGPGKILRMPEWYGVFYQISP